MVYLVYSSLIEHLAGAFESLTFLISVSLFVLLVAAVYVLNLFEGKVVNMSRVRNFFMSILTVILLVGVEGQGAARIRD